MLENIKERQNNPSVTHNRLSCIGTNFYCGVCADTSMLIYFSSGLHTH